MAKAARQRQAKPLEIFEYKGVNRTGNKITGELEAMNLQAAKAALRKQGIATRTLHKRRKPLLAKRSKVTQTDITIFTRQLATMLLAGIPLVQAFGIVIRGQENVALEKLMSGIRADIETGTPLAQALGKHPQYFNQLFCNLVHAGEQSGTLDTMLDNIATYKEKMEAIKGKIKKALFYPAAVLMVAFAVSAALLIFVVPQFESLFKGFGADLPVMTQMVVRISEVFQVYWYLIFGGVFGLFYSLFKCYKKSLGFTKKVDTWSLKAPIIGTILKKSAIARFCRTLSITFEAGLPLVEALETVAGSTGNILYAEGTMHIREQVSHGQQLNTTMRSTKLFPMMILQMVAVGEESGSLDEMLAKAADFYEREVDDAVDALSTLLEPLIMVLLGTIVGGLVIAMYLPIFQLGQVV